MKPTTTSVHRLFGLLLSITLSASAHAAELPPAEECRRALDEVIQEELAKPHRVGFSVAMALGDDLVLAKAYGSIDLEHDVTATRESLFRIGSVTKQFTAALVVQYVQQGRVRLEDRVDEHVDFPTGDRAVTVRHLLQHTSGIRSYTSVGEAFIEGIPLERSSDEVLGLVRELPLDFEPGQDFAYSNTNYFLLGLLLESIGGKPYGELLREEFVEPIGLTHTRCDSNSAIIPGRAQGYTVADDRLVNDGLLGVSQPFAAGVLLSTASDLVKWERALSSGEFITPKNFQLMNTPPDLPEGVDPYFRYGMGRIVDQWSGKSVQFHGGGINGFTAFLGSFPDDEVTLAILGNSEACDATAIAKAFWQRLQNAQPD